MSGRMYRCPNCKQLGGLGAHLLWRLEEDGTRQLEGIEVRCSTCGFTKSKGVREVPELTVGDVAELMRG